MESISLESIDQLKSIKEAQGYSVIFKHNTTCPISKLAKSNFERDSALLPEATNIYILDLLTFRNISDAIAKDFGVEHESPQLLVIKDGTCPFHQSFYDISAKAAADAMSSN